jgi:hypothetical protein
MLDAVSLPTLFERRSMQPMLLNDVDVDGDVIVVVVVVVHWRRRR